ncbi:MAG: fucokinase [Eubacteriales bacterium]
MREMIKIGTFRDNLYFNKPVINNDKTHICLPLRVNWGGTWTDTPPYCLENGGAVVNASVEINNVLPVEVIIEKLDAPKVVLEYFDSGYRGEFYKTNELSDCTNPLDPFLLLKSALVASGIVSMPGEERKESVFEIIDGGLFLSAGVAGIPKGSGLGTSSILLAACIKGIFDFMGQKVDDNEIYRRVLFAEQLLGTGGGWQDQAGGLTSGIKLVTSKPGFKQEIKCEHLKISKKFSDDLNERFCLVYSGQRRLGRTILRKIMGGYIKSYPVFTNALNEIYSLAGDIKNNIESSNFEGFIENLNRQTELTKMLDTGYINECLSNILDSCAEMTAGKMICGAGGGGFIQIILKKGYSKQDLNTRLKQSFPQQGIDVWDCEFI